MNHRISSNVVSPLCSFVKSMLKEPKNIENRCFRKGCSPLKVAATSEISLGMLSTNMGLNRLGPNGSIESRMWALGWLKLDNLAKIAVLGGFGALSQLNRALVTRILIKSTHSPRDYPPSYRYFEIRTDPGPFRQHLGGNRSIFCLTSDLGPPLTELPTVRNWLRFVHIGNSVS